MSVYRYMSVCMFVCLQAVCRPVCKTSAWVQACLYIYSSASCVSVPLCTSICLSDCVYVYMSGCMFVCLSVYLSICLSVCLRRSNNFLFNLAFITGSYWLWNERLRYQNCIYYINCSVASYPFIIYHLQMFQKVCLLNNKLPQMLNKGDVTVKIWI